MLLETVSLNKVVCCVTKAIKLRKSACLICLRLFPSINISPFFTSKNRINTWMKVDFPAPETPTMAIFLPFGISKLIFFKTSLSLKEKDTFLNSILSLKSAMEIAF